MTAEPLQAVIDPAPAAPEWPSRWPTVDVAHIGDPTTPDEPPQWILPTILEAGSRLLLAGDEGVGKSLLIAQLAVRLAAGLPALPGVGPDGPLCVLVLDGELNERTIRRRLQPLAQHADLQPGQLLYVLAPTGIDLLRPGDHGALVDLCRAYRPDLLVIDSLYRAFVGDPDDPRVGGEVQRALDGIRADIGCALLLACHYRKRANDGAKRRQLDDLAGSRVWKAWPETVIDITDKALRVLKDREGTAADLDITRTPAGQWENDPDGWPFTIGPAEPSQPWHGHTAIQPYVLAVLARADVPLSTSRVHSLTADDRTAESRQPFHRSNIAKALGELRDLGRVTTTPGARGANDWTITPAGLDATSNPTTEPA